MIDELGCLLSKSFALEQLEINSCDRIVCLKVPCSLQRLRYLDVCNCYRLEMIDIEAPNISSFHLDGDNIELSLGENLQIRDAKMLFNTAVHCSHVELPSCAPNLETLHIISSSEVANTPMLHSRFLHFKNLMVSFIEYPLPMIIFLWFPFLMPVLLWRILSWRYHYLRRNIRRF